MISISFVEDQDDLHHELKSKEPFAHPCLVIKKTMKVQKRGLVLVQTIIERENYQRSRVHKGIREVETK